MTSTDWENLSFHGVIQELRALGVRSEITDEIERACSQYPAVIFLFPKMFPARKLASHGEQIRAGGQESLDWLESQLIALLTLAIFKTTGQWLDMRHLSRQGPASAPSNQSRY